MTPRQGRRPGRRHRSRSPRGPREIGEVAPAIQKRSAEVEGLSGPDTELSVHHGELSVDIPFGVAPDSEPTAGGATIAARGSQFRDPPRCCQGGSLHASALISCSNSVSGRKSLTLKRPMRNWDRNPDRKRSLRRVLRGEKPRTAGRESSCIDGPTRSRSQAIPSDHLSPGSYRPRSLESASLMTVTAFGPPRLASRGTEHRCRTVSGRSSSRKFPGVRAASA